MRFYVRGMWAIFLILLFIVILFGGIIYLSKGSQSEKNVIETIKEFISEIINKDTPKDSSSGGSGESDGGSIFGGEDEGSSGGGSSDGESELGETCEITQISYSILNPQKTSECNQYQGSNCTDKTITCSAEINNDDTEVSGLFEIELIFIEAGKINKEDAIDIKSSTFLIDPGNYETFIDSTNIQSSGEEGLANQNINCFFNKVTIPTKCI